MARVNPQVLRANALRQALDHQRVAIAQLPDPELGLMAEDLPLPSFSPVEGPNAMLSVGISQHFPPFGQRQAQGEVVQAESEAAFYQTLATRAQVVLALRTAWIDAAYDQRAVRTLHRQQHLATESVQAARARLGANDSGISDVLRAELSEQSLENQVSKARALHAAAVATIAELLALPQPPRLARGWPALPPPPAQAALERRLADSPALRVFDHKRSAAEAKVRVARSAYHPSVTLTGSYGKTYYPGMPDSVTLGVNVSLPLFTGARQDQALAAAQAEEAAAHEEYLTQALRLTQQLRTQFAQYQSARKQRRRTEKVLLPTANAAFKAALAGYRSGAVPLRLVLKAQQAVLRYALDALRLRRNQGTAAANLAYLGTCAEGSP